MKNGTDDVKSNGAISNGKSAGLHFEIKNALEDNDLKLIDELGAEATPRQIRNWISRLEELFAEKKNRVRADVTSKVNEIIGSNSYTLEELFGARILPTTDELSTLAEGQKR